MYHDELKNIGLLLKNYLKEDNSVFYEPNEREKSIIRDEAKYNLSKAISEILLQTKLNHLTKNIFCEKLKNYNRLNSTNLKYRKLKEYGFIQEINDVIKVIEFNNQTCDASYIKFINSYEHTCIDPEIKQDTFFQILRDNNIPEKKFDDYIEYKDNIIYLTYLFFRKIYHISDKIFYRIWMSSNNKLQHFFQLFQIKELWIKPFYHLLDESEYQNYQKVIEKFISKQDDLTTGKFEFIKIISDYPHNKDRINEILNNKSLNNTIGIFYPPLFLNHQKTIENEYYDSHYQPNRWVFSKLFQTLDFENEETLNYIFSLTKNHESLYLVNHITHLLISEYIEKIPFLINSNPSLLPYIFKIIFKKNIAKDKIILDEYNFEDINHSGNDIKLDILLKYIKTLLKQSSTEITRLKNIDLNKSIYKFSKILPITISLSKTISFLYKECFQPHSSVSYHGKFKEKINIIPQILSKHIDNHNETLIYILVKLFSEEMTYKAGSHHHAFIQPNIAIFHLLINIYRLLPENHNNTKNLISNLLVKELNFFYNTKTLKTFISNNKWDIKEVTYGVSTFAFESVEWNNVLEIIISLGDLESLYDEIFKNISIKTDENSFHEHNINQKKRIIFLFKIIALSYIHTKNPDLKVILYHKVIELCLTFRKDDQQNKLLNIFEYKQGYISSNNDIYYRDTRAILCDFINALDEVEENILFIDNFFQESKDLNFLLEANNKINSEKFKNIIQKHISSVTLEDFLYNVYTIDEIEKTIVNSVNSQSNYNFARDLLPKIIEHYEKRNYKISEAINFKKNIELLLAFKEKNLLRIQEIMREPDSSREVKNKSIYYQSIYPSYYERDWDRTLQLIENLPKDLDYQFQKFRCTTLHPQKTTHEKIEAFNYFEKFLEENDNIKWNSSLLEYYRLLKLIPLSLMNRNTDFLNIFNNLTNRLKYNEETISYIYEFFVKNDLLIDSYKFIVDANHYYITINNQSEILEEIINSHDDHKTNSQIKKTLALLPNVNYRELPKVYPLESSNSKFRNYQFFIILKIVSALKLLVDKRRTIKEEDEYNDLLLILLKFKFSDFGWSLEDQTRSGTSSTKKGAGEIDIAISHKSNKIALIEAFRLKGKNITVTQEHSHKTSLYGRNLNTYYMLIYFIGDSKNFDSTWNSYQEDFLSTSFEEGYTPVNQNFEELTGMFDDVNRFHIAKTQHENNISYFHIMVDFSL